MCDYLDVFKGHAVAISKTFGIQAENIGLDGSKLNGLPNGIVDDIREFARGELRPRLPVGGCPQAVVGYHPLLGMLWGQVAEGGDGLLIVEVNEHLLGAAEEDMQVGG